MKKILLTIGALASVAAPVVAVISCGGNDKKTEKVVDKSSTEIKVDKPQQTQQVVEQTEFKVPYEVWRVFEQSKDNHQDSYRQSQEFWKSHKVNGEEVISFETQKYSYLLDKPIVKHDMFTGDTTTITTGSYYASVLTTPTKEYWLFSSSGSADKIQGIQYTDKYPTRIVDLSTKAETKFTSQEDFLAKFVVTENIEQHQARMAKEEAANAIEALKPEAPLVEQYHEEASHVSAADLATPFKLNGQAVPIENDGLYMVQKDYKGTLWNGKTISEGSAVKDLVRMTETPNWPLENSMMLEDGDSFYMLYDQDDNDGFKPDSLIQNVYFYDSSIASGSINDNVNLGHIKGQWGNYITFEKSVATPTMGRLKPYLGSQNNHFVSSDYKSGEQVFQQNIINLSAAIKDTYPDSLKRILNYYGVSINSNGQVVNVGNGASHAFAPVFSSTPIFTYEKVASNAFKFTYHFDGRSRVTAAHLMLHSTKDAANVAKQYGSLSLGDATEWGSYINHSDTKYIAIKNQYVEGK